MDQSLSGRKIIVGICGGIAAYKICSLVRLIKKAGAKVQVVMTESATRMVGPATFAALSGNPVGIDIFDDSAKIDHVTLTRDADLMVVAPATANTIAALSAGFADNLLRATVLAATCKVMVVPAMNANMFKNAATKDNLATLKKRGICIMEPGCGELACGINDVGRLPEPAEIFEQICTLLKPAAVRTGPKMVITAGPTVEAIDPVRYISNRSSGKMGFALAQAAVQAGCEVILISGPVKLETPSGVNRIEVVSAEEMLKAAEAALDDEQAVFIGCAAVADFRMKEISPLKLKKKDDEDELTLTLVKNPDLISTIGHRLNLRPYTVGFAAETDHGEENARGKLIRKALDLIVLNDVSDKSVGFNSDENAVSVFNRDGLIEKIEKCSKLKVAERLISLILTHYRATLG